MASSLRSVARLTNAASSRPRAIIRLAGLRGFHTTPAARFPYKDDQDRKSLRPGSAEHTQSGRDDQVAENEEAAFSPKKTRPESEAAAAGAGNETNPLDASGANQPFNVPQGDEKAKPSGAGKETRKGGRSGGGSAPKKGNAKRVKP